VIRAAALALVLTGAALAADDPPSASYPLPDRPVAEIVSPVWNSPEKRDAADEAGQLIRALGITAGMTIADIGAGSGYHTTRLSPVVGPTGRIFAEDVKSEYLDDLRETVAGLGNVTVIEGLPDDPKLPPRSTDIAILVHMYHEISSPYALMARLSAAIKPGGKVAVVDLDRATHLHGTPIGLLRCELAAVGYIETGFVELSGDIGYVAIFTPPAEPPAPETIKPCPNPDRG
jgi:predicted methyltransferase